MTLSRTIPAGDRIIEPMVALAGCSKQHRIVVAGAKGVELMLELQRRGYVRAAATANCGHPAGQYDVALVDWRRRTFKTLEVALDWLVDFLSPSGVLVVWVDPQKTSANETLRLSLERRGFVIEGGTVHDCGCAVSARRREINPVRPRNSLPRNRRAMYHGNQTAASAGNPRRRPDSRCRRRRACREHPGIRPPGDDARLRG